MNKEKARKEYRVTAKKTRFYEALVWADTEDEAWQEAMEKPEMFEECITYNDWQKVNVGEV